MTFNPLTAIIDADKTWPETVSLPDALENANPLQLAEARFRLSRLAQVATALRRIVDEELADQLEGGALRYGDSILKPSLRGNPRVIDHQMWWVYVANAVRQTNDPGALLSAMFNADNVRMGGLALLAAATGDNAAALKDTFIAYDSPASGLSTQPLSQAPKWTQKLAEGEFSRRRVD